MARSPTSHGVAQAFGPRREPWEGIDRGVVALTKIDLTILDINMPGMGGYQCLKELLCLDPKLKVLIASGCSIDVQAPEVLESGALGFIPKPYRISELSKVLDQVFRSAPGAGSP